MRKRALNDAPRGNGPVVYWMTSQRRLAWNHALDHAVARANELGKGLLILESLHADEPWATKRSHTFVEHGMEEHAQACAAAGIAYEAFIEPEPGARKGVLDAYARHASCLVVDDHPGQHARVLTAEAARLPVRAEAVDSVGVLPLALPGQAYATAYQFRRFIQKNLAGHIDHPLANPLETVASGEPPADAVEYSALPQFEHDVAPVAGIPGGSAAAVARMQEFVGRLDRYPQRNQPDEQATSGLSPYLHTGHVGAAQVVATILEQEDWNPGRIGQAKGQREGWWGLSEGAEAFLDQLITWRELGHVEARWNPDWMRFEGLPAWAKDTLEAHERDRVAPVDFETLEAASTDDPIWNAAQRQLVQEGTIHNYLRMLWGKNILAWAPSARIALDWMLQLNDKYALDGRDPNSVSGIFWCLGRYDRPWPERDVFGKVRCMTSASTKRKLRLDGYLGRWGES